MDLDDKTMNLIWWHFYWSDVTVSRKGKCHTFYSPVDLVGSEWLFQFTGDADVNKIRLTIHDPDYFLITESPSTVQQKNLMIDQGFYAMYLDFTHKIELSQEEQPCESSESYSFTICVRNSVSKKVGCRYILIFINAINLIFLFNLTLPTTPPSHTTINQLQYLFISMSTFQTSLWHLDITLHSCLLQEREDLWNWANLWRSL